MGFVCPRIVIESDENGVKNHEIPLANSSIQQRQRRGMFIERVAQ
jgi:hypothetical protein